MERIGRYRILGEAGRGAMGVVYRAADPAIGREVAIKTIRLSGADPSSRDKLRERLFREARSAGVLSHPNIVTIFDMGEAESEDSGPVAFVAMGLVKGPSLEALMARAEPLDSRRLFSLLRQAAVALDYAHSRGVVHRDIKPANIMTDEDGSVKITDFGIARFIAAERLNETHAVTGTPNYMAPEQIQGLPVDGRADQFSLGVIAWEMFTGERPFAGDNISSVVYQIVSEEPHPAHHINGTLSPRVDEVLRRALAKDAAQRFPNCASFVGSLEAACAESPGWKPIAAGVAPGLPTTAVDWTPPAPVPVPEPVVESREESSSPPVKDKRWLYTIAAIAIAAAFSAFALWRDQPTAPVVTRAETKTALDPPTAPPAPAPLEAIKEQPKAEEPPKASPSPVVETARMEAMPVGKLQDIWLETSPPAASVVLDGNREFSCATPCVLRARRGTHQLTFSLAGYRVQRREIRVEEAAIELPVVALERILSSLMVSSEPAGATILVNGQRQSQPTPAQLSLPPGLYTVTVEKDGMTRTERVTLGENPHLLRVPLTR